MECAVDARPGLGWRRFVLLSPDVDASTTASLATAPNAMEAFVQLVPDLILIASGHGKQVLALDGSRLENAEFAPDSDWILVGIDRDGRRYAVLPSGVRRAGTNRDVWHRITETARRVAQRRWAELDTIVHASTGTAAAASA